MSSLSKRPSRRARVALLAGDREAGRYTLVAQGKITQLVTVPEVRCVVVQARFHPQRAPLWMVIVACGLPG